MILSPSRTSFDRITERLWLGSRIASLDDFHRIRAQGVRACVDMKEEGADPWPFEAFLWLPTLDHEAPSLAHLRIGVDFLRRCEAESFPVYVTCYAGVGRSTTLVLAHLLASRFRGGTVDEALAFIRARRPAVNPTASQVEAARQVAFETAPV